MQLLYFQIKFVFIKYNLTQSSKHTTQYINTLTPPQSKIIDI